MGRVGRGRALAAAAAAASLRHAALRRPAPAAPRCWAARVAPPAPLGRALAGPQAAGPHAGGGQRRRGGTAARVADPEATVPGQLATQDDRGPSVFGSACLVGGAAVGGGFLALPRATAASGLVPATVGLTVTWLYLVLCSTALAEAALRVMVRAEEEEVCSVPEGDLLSEEAGRLCKSGGGGDAVSLFTIVYAATRMSERTTYRVAAGGLLSLTTLSFLVCAGSVLAAQISKAGVLLARPLGASVEGATVAAALLMLTLTFGLGERAVLKLSTAFTGGVIASFAAVLAGALVAAQRLHPARLLRAEWGRMLPPVAALGNEVWVVNVFLQLLCFGEVVCLVCGRHGPGRPRAVLAALWLGSMAPLVMAILWTAAVINLTPRSVSAGLADPLEALLTGSATTAVPVAVMATFAILTTVIGTALAKRQFISDMFGEPSERSRLLISLGVLGVPSVIALFGGDLFYRAMAFCGGYPALLLWGVAPPWLCWQMRRQDSATPGRSRVRALLPGGSPPLWVLSACGLGVLLTNMFVFAVSIIRARGLL